MHEYVAYEYEYEYSQQKSGPTDGQYELTDLDTEVRTTYLRIYYAPRNRSKQSNTFRR